MTAPSNEAAGIAFSSVASGAKDWRISLSGFLPPRPKSASAMAPRLSPPSPAAGETESPSFLAFHPSKKFLYAVNENKATISAFAIDEKTGNLTFLNSQPSKGGAPCHLMVDPTGKNVLAAHCHQTEGGQYIDVGIADVLDAPE